MLVYQRVVHIELTQHLIYGEKRLSMAKQQKWMDSWPTNEWINGHQRMRTKTTIHWDWHILEYNEGIECDII